MKDKKEKKKKKTPKRSAFSKSIMNKYRRDAVDYDYVDKLNAEELAYLQQFTDEYYHNNFENKNIDIHSKFNEIYEDPDEYELTYNKRKYVKKSNPNEKIDTYTKVKRELYRQNIARQVCIYNLSKVGNRLDYIKSLQDDFNIEKNINSNKISVDELFMLAVENGYVDTYSEFLDILEECSGNSGSDSGECGDDD